MSTWLYYDLNDKKNVYMLASYQSKFTEKNIKRTYTTLIDVVIVYPIAAPLRLAYWTNPHITCILPPIYTKKIITRIQLNFVLRNGDI